MRSTLILEHARNHSSGFPGSYWVGRKGYSGASAGQMSFDFPKPRKPQVQFVVLNVAACVRFVLSL